MPSAKPRANIRANDARVRAWNEKPALVGDYVVYWSQATRRADDNVALEFAIKRANELSLPVVVYESIRTDYPYASDRVHAFVLACARDTQRRLRSRGIDHGFFLPRNAEEAKGIAADVFSRAALIVSDDNPSFVFPKQNWAAAQKTDCSYLTVDDSTIVPLALIPAHESQARTIRPKLMAMLDQWLAPVVEIEPKFAAKIDWPFDPIDFERHKIEKLVASCDIDHEVAPVADRPGGSIAAAARLAAFLGGSGKNFQDSRDVPDQGATSGLSPYLHFGAISARACVLAARAAGLPKEAYDAFVEQLVVRRGLAFNHAARVDGHATWDAIPDWAKKTLAEHAKDERPDARPPAKLEQAKSGDEIWDAAQRELMIRGRMHNAVRMFWGKRLIQLCKRPRDAFDVAIRNFDRYALDGRDPNTYAGIGWCFGLHDRPFPERAIYGNVRPMGTGALKKRFDVKAWAASIPPLP